MASTTSGIRVALIPARLSGTSALQTRCQPWPWDLTDVWYATSTDGHTWQEQGPAVERGPAGSYDERSIFTPDVLAHEGRYYLVYQVTAAPTWRSTPESIAIAWADSPRGPWA